MASCIFFTGGVISSLGKGIAAASVGRMLTSRGLKVAVVKMDPYLNVDPGTMSPFQHGEVFVTADGTETDLDLGHYERFIDTELTASSNLTAGRVYRDLIERERKGLYLGGTIQSVPHVTDKIKEHIHGVIAESKADVVLVEVGGTVGDIEGLPFIEAIRQLNNDERISKTCYVHLTLLPKIGDGELKTKPTQHSVQQLRGMGIQPNLLLCRADEDVPDEARKKIAMHADVPFSGVIGLPTMENIYEVPPYLEKQGVGDLICDLLNIKSKPADLDKWSSTAMRKHDDDDEVDELKIAIVGKYVNLPDSYLSVVESLHHAELNAGCKLEIVWVDSNNLKSGKEVLSAVDGILVPGGFDKRGISGMLTAAKYARTMEIPYLGLCLGMQVMVIEYAKNVLGLADANSAEFDENTPDPVIHLMPAQHDVSRKGGTMRLGNWKCRIEDGTHARRLYGEKFIQERHRHRYELNPDYASTLAQKGLIISGFSEPYDLAEICEVKEHPFMVGCQFHPEFTSRVDHPHPLFKGFVDAALEYNQKRCGRQLDLNQPQNRMEELALKVESGDGV